MAEIGLDARQGNADDLAGESLSVVLERDHRAIDSGIEAFAAGGAVTGAEASAGGPDRAALAGSIDRLRRHIYVEEEILFPALLDAGLAGPIMVMLREHALMWRTLDGLELLLGEDGPATALEPVCRELMDLLQRHNTKEEMILYVQADALISPETATQVRTALASAELPDGWVCQNL